MTTRRADVVTAAAIAALAGAHFAWVRPTNFLGYDEWMILWLTSRGIVSQPHAGRPLALIGNLPAAWLAPDRLAAHAVCFAAYLALTGIVVFALVRAVVPRLRVVAALAGVLASVWAPLDYQRLDSVHMTVYAAMTLGAVLALALFLASLRRSSVPLLAAAAAVAVVTALSYEGALPLMIAPALAAAAWWPGARRRVAWAGAWAGVGILGALPAVAGYLQRRGQPAYQAAYPLDLSPARMAGRLLRHHAFDLVPAVSTPLAQVAVLPAALGAAALVGVVLAARAGGLGAVEPADRRTLAGLAAGGLVLGAVGHLPFITSPGLTTPNRTQFLCAPGTALFLAAAVALAASFCGPRWRLAALTALGAWLVAVAAGRTAAHQRTWDARSAYPAQVELLRRLVALAPDLRPNTLVVLLDGRGAWPDTYGFDHAVRYLYEGRARGYVWSAPSLFYPTTFAPDGIRRQVRADVRAAWRESDTFHRYDETVAVRRAADGSVTILERWPARVAVSPAAASYDPRARIVTGGAEPRARRILR